MLVGVVKKGGFVEGDAGSVVAVAVEKTVEVLTPLLNKPWLMLLLLLLFFLKALLTALLTALLAAKLARTVIGVLGIMTAGAAVAGKLRGPG